MGRTKQTARDGTKKPLTMSHLKKLCEDAKQAQMYKESIIERCHKDRKAQLDACFQSVGNEAYDAFANVFEQKLVAHINQTTSYRYFIFKLADTPGHSADGLKFVPELVTECHRLGADSIKKDLYALTEQTRTIFVQTGLTPPTCLEKDFMVGVCRVLINKWNALHEKAMHLVFLDPKLAPYDLRCKFVSA